MTKFAVLFKKYRLKAEFDTISAFSDALSEKGYFYDESIFSHWQKGTRIPAERKLVLTLIAIFNERGTMQTLREANEFLESSNQGFLTEKEQEQFHFTKDQLAPFQVPSEIAHFIGREKILQKIKKEITTGKILLLHGPPGVGKTALAIKLGHILRNQYPDGVLWYKVDSSNVMDILLSIAHIFGEDISNIKDIEVRASVVRTLLSDKKLLLIFDNVSNDHALQLLIPSSPTTAIIFTSRESFLTISNSFISVPVSTFTAEETIALFKNIFNANFVKKNSKQVIELAEKLGHLPLALQMAANYLKKSDTPFQTYIQELNDDSIDLNQMKYEDKNLSRAITINFNTLDKETQSLFISLGIFEGKDFSMEAVSYVNRISNHKTKQLLQKLMDISFVEESSNNRYRIHPLIKIFARKKLNGTSYYLRAAQYFENLLARADEKHCMKALKLEVDNIIYVFKKCYEVGYWDQVITLWNPIEKFLADNNEIKKLRALTNTIDTAPQINIIQKIFTYYYLVLSIFWVIIFINITYASIWGYTFSFLMGLTPLIGGLVGVYRSKKWGLFRNSIGKAIFFISLGLASWGFGNAMWAYYNFFQNNNIPYPSLSDIGFFPAYFLWIAGIFYLSRATKTKLEIKHNLRKLFLLIIPCIILYFSYYFLFFIVDRSYDSETPIRIIFDLYYPSMNIVILTVALIIFGLSVNFFGGKYKLSLFAILFGYVFLYGGDFMFSYLTSTGGFFTGGITDIFYLTAFYLITWGTLSFYLTPKKQLKTINQV